MPILVTLGEYLDNNNAVHLSMFHLILQQQK